MISRLSPHLLLILLCLGLATARPAYAQENEPRDVCLDSCCLTDVLLLNTGYDHLAGMPYGPGDHDPFWHVIADPGGGVVPRASNVVDPNAFGWPAQQNGSQWISNGDRNKGVITFEKCFCVCGPDSTDLTLNLAVLTTGKTDISVDGNVIGTIPAANNVPKPITATVRVGPGIHCIELDVDNGKGGNAGVDVQGTVIGNGLVRYTCCNSIIDEDDECKLPRVTLATDASWTLTDGPPTTGPYPRCADLVSPAQWPPWGAPIAGTNWISATPSGNSQEPYEHYNYRKCFCMREAGTVVITLTIMADGVCTVFLDGVDIHPSGPFSDWHNPETYTFIAALGAGCHCFDFSQEDYLGGLTGLDVLLDIQGPNIADPRCCECPDCNNPAPRRRDGEGLGAAGVGGGHAAGAMMLAIPNPTNGSTIVRYMLVKPADVSMSLYDAAGRLVRPLDSGARTAGEHQVTLDATALPAGTYRSVLTVDGKIFSVPVTVR